MSELSIAPVLTPLQRFHSDPAGSVQVAPLILTQPLSHGGKVSVWGKHYGVAFLFVNECGDETRIGLSHEAIMTAARLYGELTGGEGKVLAYECVWRALDISQQVPPKDAP